MSTWKVILATLIIFTAGVITGGLVVKSSTPKANRPKEPTALRTDMLRRLTRDLDLSPTQRTKVNEVLQESSERTKILRDLIEPELRAEYRKAVDDIRAELTSEQKARFDELLKQRQQRKPGFQEKRRPANSNHLSTVTNVALSASDRHCATNPEAAR